MKKATRSQQKDSSVGTPRTVSPDGENVRNRIGHFIMNLPDTAIKFLAAFRGALKSEKWSLRGLYYELPMVHCYCFTRFLEPAEAEADIKKVSIKPFAACSASDWRPFAPESGGCIR